jgi:hypothetical protein
VEEASTTFSSNRQQPQQPRAGGGKGWRLVTAATGSKHVGKADDNRSRRRWSHREKALANIEKSLQQGRLEKTGSVAELRRKVRSVWHEVAATRLGRAKNWL